MLNDDEIKKTIEDHKKKHADFVANEKILWVQARERREWIAAHPDVVPSPISDELQAHLDRYEKHLQNKKTEPAVVHVPKISLSDYAKAEAYHITNGPASEADAAARLAICMACPDRAVTYKEQTDAGGVGWCTKCGCGNNPRALLTVKVTMAGVECPLAKWGKVEGTGASVASTVDAVAGVAKSIIHKLSGG